mgnify:CR=1 FL=1
MLEKSKVKTQRFGELPILHEKGQFRARTLSLIDRVMADPANTNEVQADQVVDIQPSQKDELVGNLIGNTRRILRKLGIGGMGAVYEAEHIALGSRVAIKILDIRRAGVEEYKTRFLQEARAMTQVKHPNVVRVEDFGTSEDGNPFIVMEYVEGEDLADRLERDKKLSWKDSKPLVMQIGNALKATHRAGIVHRDIKPENVMIEDSTGAAKLTDFGIAKAQNDKANLCTTHEDIVMGTPYYMSPEQAEGASNVDERSDIYALGIMLYHMFTGYVPFDANSPSGVLAKQIQESPIPPKESCQEIPAALEAVILKAMAKSPSDRYQSMDEMIAELDSISIQESPAQEVSNFAPRLEIVPEDEIPFTENVVVVDLPSQEYQSLVPEAEVMTAQIPPLRRRLGRTLKSLAIAASLAASVGVGGAFLASSNYKTDVKKVDTPAQVDSDKSNKKPEVSPIPGIKLAAHYSE